MGVLFMCHGINELRANIEQTNADPKTGTSVTTRIDLEVHAGVRLRRRRTDPERARFYFEKAIALGSTEAAEGLRSFLEQLGG